MNIRWYTGSKCNFDCVHCFDKRVPKIQFDTYVFDIDKSIKFVESFNREVTVGFVGGEPMMSKNIIEFIKWLTHNGHEVAIITNLTYKIKELVDTCNMNSVHMFVSLHFRQLKEKNLQNIFIDNYNLLKQLKDKDAIGSLFVSEVAEPTYTKEEIEKYTKLYKVDNGIDFSFNVYLDIDNNLTPYSYTAEQEQYFNIETIVTTISQCAVNPECGAGVNYILMESNGDVYPCEGIRWDQTEKPQEHYMGNFFTGDVKILETPPTCLKKSCACATTCKF